MAAPSIPVKFVHRFEEAGAQRIEMDVAHQFEKIWLFVANDRLVSVLEEMAGTPVPEVEGHGVTGQKAAHEFCQGSLARAQQEVDMVFEQGPGETVGFGRDQQIRKPSHELATIFIVGKNITSLDTADDNVLQEVRNVDASGTWMGEA